MGGLSYHGWMAGGRFEDLRASVLFLVILMVDVWILMVGYLNDSLPGIEILMALLALNVVGIGLCIHWVARASVRSGFWTRMYPLSVTTVLDAVIGYFHEKDVALRSVGEKHIYTDSFSDVFKCKRPRFEVRLRPVTFLGKGVSVHIGPETKNNKKVVRAFLRSFDDFIEKDLREGIPAGDLSEE